jgi:DMSO/TMAO reductase YedYZ molybdopterin-dependent catalytic subunit
VWRILSDGARAVLPNGLEQVVPQGARGWRIYSVGASMPRFDRATWRLRIDGLVERELVLSYDDLLALPRAQQVSDFHCVTGWSVQDVGWAGVRFGDLLGPARPRPQATAVRFVSSEKPYVDCLTLAQTRLPDAMLAYEMDGRPLSRPHGAPVRVVMPRMYGYKGVKWLDRIELIETPVVGYWEQRGYDRDPWVEEAVRAARGRG